MLWAPAAVAAESAAAAAATAPLPPHPLQNSWCIWEHEASKNSSDWGSNMTSLGDFNTVEGFWKYYNHIPKPSQVRAACARSCTHPHQLSEVHQSSGAF
jgi:Eukaryotic initiation factor 4E